MKDTNTENRLNDIIKNIVYQFNLYIKVLQNFENNMISLNQSTSEALGLYIVITSDFENIFKYETNFVRNPINIELSNEQGIEANVLKMFFISELEKFNTTKLINTTIVKEDMKIFYKKLQSLLNEYLIN